MQEYVLLSCLFLFKARKRFSQSRVGGAKRKKRKSNDQLTMGWPLLGIASSFPKGLSEGLCEIRKMESHPWSRLPLLKDWP